MSWVDTGSSAIDVQKQFYGGGVSGSGLPIYQRCPRLFLHACSYFQPAFSSFSSAAAATGVL